MERGAVESAVLSGVNPNSFHFALRQRTPQSGAISNFRWESWASLLRFKKVDRHWSMGAQLLQLFCSCSQCKTAVIASGLGLGLVPMMVRAPISMAPVESLGTKCAEPRSVVAKARANNHANYWRPSIEDRARRWRRVIVRWPGSAVRLNHFSAGIRPRNRRKAQCEHGRCYHS